MKEKEQVNEVEEEKIYEATLEEIPARKHPLLSRKFWLAVVTVGTMILANSLGLNLDPETIVAIILPVVAYILGESYIDAKH